MKNLKTYKIFESGSEVVQQPFYMSKDTGSLFLTKEMGDYILKKYGFYNDNKMNVETKMKVPFQHRNNNTLYLNIKLYKYQDLVNIKGHGKFYYSIGGSTSTGRTLWGTDKYDIGKMFAFRIGNNLISELIPGWSGVKDPIARMKRGEKFFDIYPPAIDMIKDLGGYTELYNDMDELGLL